MPSIEAKVQINADRTVTVKFPADMQLPANIQTGEYDAVLVLNNSSGSIAIPESSPVHSEPPDNLMTDDWEKWVEEVEQLPLSPNSVKEGDYQQYLVEKYRKQGLVL